MTAQKGKDLLIKIADGAGYTTVAGLRTRQLAFNTETVDVTHSESVNRWRELLDGAGVKHASFRRLLERRGCLGCLACLAALGAGGADQQGHD